MYCSRFFKLICTMKNVNIDYYDCFVDNCVKPLKDNEYS